MDCDLPPPPETGPRGLVISEFSVEQEQEIEVSRYLPPSLPGRAIYRYDEDAEGFVFERNRTDEELATAIASYEKAFAKWSKSGGLHRQLGPVNTTARVKFADGRIGEASWTGSEWIWTSINDPS